MSVIDVELRAGQNVKKADLSKGGNDQVRWISKDESSYELTFVGTGPFSQSSFVVPAGKFIMSDLIRNDVIPPEDPAQTVDFKYTAVHAASGWLLDPKIGVKK